MTLVPTEQHPKGKNDARRFRRYPEYKDSGVNWLGTIPAHWLTVRLKCEFLIQNGSTPRSEEPAFWDGGIPWVTPEDLGELRSSEITRPRRCITSEGYQSCGTTLVSAGSLVLSTRAPIGHVAIAGVELCTNQGCRSLVFRHECNRKYFFYQCVAARSEFESLGQGSTFKELATDKLETVSLTHPPVGDQRDIADFLDRETAKIDALVAKKERLIELLREKRAELITQAVTKGLDPAVPMRESGIEWLGEIPAHWNLPLAGRLILEIEQGWSPVADERSATDDEWAVIKLSAVSQGKFRAEEHKALPSDVSPETRYEIGSEDFLMTRANTPELVGDVCVVRSPRRYLMLCDLVYRLRLRVDRVDASFLAYWFLSGVGRHQIEVDARGSSQSMVKISQGHIRQWRVPLPPLEEQRSIVLVLDGNMAILETLISRIGQGIDRTTEFRSALIAAAVTGKIDVREEVT